jgi:hypothetical protein
MQHRPRTSQAHRYRATLPCRDSYTHSHEREAYPVLRPCEIMNLLEEVDRAVMSISRKYRLPMSCVLMIMHDRDRVRRED